MKRLVFCFDGTWNCLDAPHSTNVVITAESVLPIASDGVSQAIFYDEGVGTRKGEKLSGGLFGHGIVENLGDAYRFLIFNHTPGDEIYIFGFSRGAYTARSFAGLLSTCGLLRRSDAAKVTDAVLLYQQRKANDAAFDREMTDFRRQYSPQVCVSDADDLWRSQNVPDYKIGSVPRLRVTYLGVWDTVGALGVPARYKWLNFLDRKYDFHDTSLSTFVKSARHAVAIDERRKDFVPTLWDNVDEMNTAASAKAEADDAPYQQKWFPGVHGSVGGGGERRGLSDRALGLGPRRGAPSGPRARWIGPLADLRIGAGLPGIPCELAAPGKPRHHRQDHGADAACRPQARTGSPVRSRHQCPPALAGNAGQAEGQDALSSADARQGGSTPRQARPA